MTTKNVKKTQQQYFDNFVALYGELSTINEDIKQLSESYKEDYADGDLANLKKVSKLVAEQKLGEALDKLESFKEAVDTFQK